MKIFSQPITFSWIKENLAAIILIPTLIGGLWQLLELLFIGPAYIRFFSISQLVPDGILLIFVFLLMLFLSQNLVKSIIRSIANFSTLPKPNNISESGIESPTIPPNEKFFIDQNSSWMSKKDGYIMIAILLTLLIVISSPHISLNDSLSGLFKFLMLFVYIFLYLAVAVQIVSILLDIYKVKINAKNRLVTAFRGILGPVFLLISILIIARFVILVHRSLALPYDLKNAKYLDCKVHSNNHRLLGFQLLYFNDKYIFVKVSQDSATSFIEVFKFDEFTNSNNCNDSTTVK